MARARRTLQTFRIVPTDGRTRSVTVALGPEGWGEKSFEAAYECRHATARQAAVGYAVARGWEVAEVRGPGELTTGEQLEAVRRSAYETGTKTWRALGGEGGIPVHGAELVERARVVVRERQEARAWVERMTAEARVLTCAFCGEAYPPGAPPANHEALAAHVAVCAKHPMRAVEAERDALRAQLEGLVARGDGEQPARLARLKHARRTLDACAHRGGAVPEADAAAASVQLDALVALGPERWAVALERTWGEAPARWRRRVRKYLASIDAILPDAPRGLRLYDRRHVCQWDARDGGTP